MTVLGRWYARIAALVGAVTLAVFVPVAAWASSGPGELVLEAARRRGRGIGGFGLLGGLCCLVVVGVIVVIVVLMMRNRRSGGRR